uniref:Uncharacterized protein n=1 Tax=Cucumis melo TaxID=3656 RepID=A0A9I9EJW9_CUCME
MGNCFSNKAVGQSSIAGTAFSQSTTSNVAIDCFLLSRGYQGLYSQIEGIHVRFVVDVAMVASSVVAYSKLHVIYSHLIRFIFLFLLRF